METIATKEAPAAVGPYAQAIGSGATLFCSGQVALDPATGVLHPGGIHEQTERALQNLRAVLAAGGSGPARVVKTTVFLTDMADFAAMNEAYARFFGDHRPARSTVAVAALPKGARVEIEAVAERG